MSKTKEPILNKLFKDSNTYVEEAIELNREEFIKVVKSRRSVRIYNESKVKEEDMLECLEQIPSLLQYSFHTIFT